MVALPGEFVWSSFLEQWQIRSEGRPRVLLTLLGGSGVVISGVICPLIWVITIVTLLTTPLITTPEPPSRV